MFRPSHRYNKLPTAARRFARVPRYGRLVSRLDDRDLERLRTEADLFWYGYSYIGSDEPTSHTGIIDDALRTSATARFGWHDDHSSVNLSNPMYREWQIRLAMAMLGAVAFEILFGKGTTLPSKELRYYVRYQGGQWVKDVLKQRVIDTGAYRDVMDQPMSPNKVFDDWEKLLQMESSGMQHFVFANVGTRGNGEIRFNDISTHAFLAAYWVCNYGTRDNAFPSLWRCLPDEFRDSNRVYREFWRFVAEIPEYALYDPNEASPRGKWCELLAPVFDPRREKCMQDSDGHLIRSNELMCRSWMSMRELRKSRPHSWALFSQIRSTEFQEILAGKFGNEKQQIARSLLFAENGKSAFIGLCQRELENDNGVFIMGSDGECGFNESGPAHKVRLSHYRLHRYALSNIEYELFNRRHGSRREFETKVPSVDHHPVVNVSWWDALAIALWIDELEIEGSSYEVLLPTEAQWEYACRAGSSKPFSIIGMTGDSISGSYCNFDANIPWPKNDDNPEIARISIGRTIPVDGHTEDGRLIGHNSWGFSQLHGNVWEWVHDRISHKYPCCLNLERECLDPTGGNRLLPRVMRGGSWRSVGRHCTASFRGEWHGPTYNRRGTGFRLAAVPIEPSRGDGPHSKVIN